MSSYVLRRFSTSLSAAAILVTPGSALATLCRCVIQIGSLNESHVLPAPSYQTSAFDGRSIPAVCDACINGVPPRALLRVNAEPGSRQSRDDGMAIPFRQTLRWP